MIFILVSLIFYAGLALTVYRLVAHGEMIIILPVRVCVLCARIATEAVTCKVNQGDLIIRNAS